MIIKNALIEFHRDILKWIEDGQPSSPVFYRGIGLCTNSVQWASANGYSSSVLKAALLAEFRAAGLDDTYPFYLEPGEPGQIRKYTEEEEMGAASEYNAEENMYVNERRLNWIREFAARELTND